MEEKPLVHNTASNKPSYRDLPSITSKVHPAQSSGPLERAKSTDLRRQSTMRDYADRSEDFKNKVQQLVTLKKTKGLQSDEFKSLKAKLRDLLKDRVFTITQTLIGRKRRIVLLKMTKDAETIATVYDNKELVVWRRDHNFGNSFRAFQTLSESEWSTNLIAMSRSGHVLICGTGSDKNLVVLEKNAPHKQYSLVQGLNIGKEDGEIGSIALSSNGDTLLCGTEGLAIYILSRSKETQLFKKSQIIEDFEHYIFSIAVGKDGMMFVTEDSESGIMIWRREEEDQDFELWQEVVEKKGEEDSGTVCVAISHDNSLISFGTSLGLISILRLDTETKKYLRAQKIQEYNNKIKSLTFSYDNEMLFSGAIIWSRDPITLEFKLSQRLEGTNRLSSISQTPGKVYLVTSGTAEIKIWEREKKVRSCLKKSKILKGHSGLVDALAISKNQSVLVSGGDDKMIIIWVFEEEYRGFNLFQKLKQHNSEIRSLKLSREGRVLASLDKAGFCLVWIRNQGSQNYTLIKTLESQQKIRSIALSVSGDLLVVGCNDKKLTIWRRGEELGEKFKSYQALEGHLNSGNSIAISEDNKLLVSGSSYQSVLVHIFDEEDSFQFEFCTELLGSTSRVLSVTISKHKGKIFAGFADGKIAIWKASEKLDQFWLFQMLESSRKVSSLVLSGNNKVLTSGSDPSNFVEVWRKDIQKYQKTCSYLPTSGAYLPLTCSESAIYTGFYQQVEVIPRDANRPLSLFVTDYNYAAVLYDALAKPDFREAMVYLLQNFPALGHKFDDLTPARVFMALHSGANLLYWLSAFEYPYLLGKALTQFDYLNWVFTHSAEFDPFLYCLENKNKRILDVWADYFTENPDRLSMRGRSLLWQLMGSPHPKIQGLGIKKLIIKAWSLPGVETIKNFGINEHKGFECTGSERLKVTSEINSELRKAEGDLFSLAPVEAKSTSVPLFEDLGTNLGLIEGVKMMTPANKLQMRPLISTLYQKNVIYFYVYSAFQVIGVIIFFVIIVFREYGWYSLIPFYVIFTLMFLFELSDFFRKGRRYLYAVYNWLDFLLYPTAMALTYYVVDSGYDFLEDQLTNSGVAFVLLVALCRVISMLRVFNSTRYLILLVLKVYLDITPFLIMLLVYVLGTGSVYMVVRQAGEDLEEITLRQFWIRSDIIYNWGFANWHETSEMNALTYTLYIVTGVFLGLVMFNTLIAIIFGTHQKFVEKKRLIDTDELLDMLLPMATFLGAWGVVERLCRGKVYSDHGKVYFHFLVPKGLTKEVDQIMKRFGALEEVVEANQRQVLEKVEKSLEEIKAGIDAKFVQQLIDIKRMIKK